MSLMDDYKLFVAKLDMAIDSALDAEISDGLKQSVQDKTIELVYRKYSPRQYARRYYDGGLADKDNYQTRVTGDHLLLLGNATRGAEDWDNRFITEIVETGVGYDFYSPGPRPFMNEALVSYAQGEAKDDIVHALERRGIHGIKVVD